MEVEGVGVQMQGVLLPLFGGRYCLRMFVAGDAWVVLPLLVVVLVVALTFVETMWLGKRRRRDGM